MADAKVLGRGMYLAPPIPCDVIVFGKYMLFLTPVAGGGGGEESWGKPAADMADMLV
jgi:hypothetical protein